MKVQIQLTLLSKHVNLMERVVHMGMNVVVMVVGLEPVRVGMVEAVVEEERAP